MYRALHRLFVHVLDSKLSVFSATTEYTILCDRYSAGEVGVFFLRMEQRYFHSEKGVINVRLWSVMLDALRCNGRDELTVRFSRGL